MTFNATNKEKTMASYFSIAMRMGDFRLPVNPIDTFSEARWNQKRGGKIGPFLSEEGRSLWFDLYYFDDKLTVHSESRGIPCFLFSNAILDFYINCMH